MRLHKTMKEHREELAKAQTHWTPSWLTSYCNWSCCLLSQALTFLFVVCSLGLSMTTWDELPSLTTKTACTLTVSYSGRCWRGECCLKTPTKSNKCLMFLEIIWVEFTISLVLSPDNITGWLKQDQPCTQASIIMFHDVRWTIIQLYINGWCVFSGSQ